MDKIKKGLGRGLSSLIGETKVETKKNQLSVSDIVPNKYQPRKNFDEDSLDDLTNSIKQRGILQPIIVRQSENFVKIFKNKKNRFTSSKDVNIRNLEREISEKIGLNVVIKNNKRNKGSITFSYKEIEQLNKIIEIIKSNY